MTKWVDVSGKSSKRRCKPSKHQWYEQGLKYSVGYIERFCQICKLEQKRVLPDGPLAPDGMRFDPHAGRFVR